MLTVHLDEADAPQRRALQTRLARIISKLALIRQALLISEEGRLILSPLAESVQIRHLDYDHLQAGFYKFELKRPPLFGQVGGGLQSVEREIPLFFSHGDVFQLAAPPYADIPDSCTACHLGGAGLTESLLSDSRQRFPLPTPQPPPRLIETTPAREAQLVIAWKRSHRTWQRLERF